MSAFSDHLSTSAESLSQYYKAQQNDQILQQILQYCQNGWPDSTSLHGTVKRYWHARHDITKCDDILLFQNRTIIPQPVRESTMQKIPHGHQGIESCQLRMNSAVWWPGSSGDMEEFVQRCPTYMCNCPPVTEAMIHPHYQITLGNESPPISLS